MGQDLILCPLYADAIAIPLRVGRDYDFYVVFGENLGGEHKLPEGFQEVSLEPLLNDINSPRDNQPTRIDGFGRRLQYTLVWHIKECCPVYPVESRFRDDPWTRAAFNYLYTLPDDTKVVIYWN